MSVASFSTTSSRRLWGIGVSTRRSSDVYEYSHARQKGQINPLLCRFHTSDGRWVKTLMVRQREGYATRSQLWPSSHKTCQSSHRVCLFDKRFSESVFNVYFFPNYFPLSGLDLLYDYSRSSLGSRSNLTEGSRSTISGSTIDLEDRFWVSGQVAGSFVSPYQHLSPTSIPSSGPAAELVLKMPISPIHLTLSTSAYPFQEPNTSRYKSKTRFEPILDALPATLDGKSSILDRVIHCKWTHPAHCHAFYAGKKGTWGQESTFGKWFIRAMKRMLFSWSSSHIIFLKLWSISAGVLDWHDVRWWGYSNRCAL